MEGDPARLIQLFENVFRNAIEHGGDVELIQVGALHGDTRVDGSPDRYSPGILSDRDSDNRTPRTGGLRIINTSVRQYTAEAHSIDSSVDPYNGSIHGFFIADDGVGIPEENREAIFEDGYTTSEDGTGLGLSIISEIVKTHDWRLDVTESETGGARFEIKR
ncbi:MAG: ATP-binding protein [Halobacteriales archaeon]